MQVFETGCLGPCAAGPVAVVHPDGILYQNLKPADAERIAEEHLLKGRIVEGARVRDSVPESMEALGLQEIPFFRKQVKIVLRNCGLIDPLKIEEYIARDGYMALAKVLTEMTPEQVIDEVKKSGLRGRGGAGFSTGMKWELCRKAPGTEKFTLCNADEGDPGAFMDRSVLEGDPHSLIEAMTIAGYAIGSSQGYVYVRAEYPLAVERLTRPSSTRASAACLARTSWAPAHSFDLEIRMGSGAFVCGEETALMTSIEGNRGEPRPRPPFPAFKGLWGKPSLLNNVETYAAIPAIILKGSGWYASMGTAKSKGTKVFALAGAVKNTGLVEIPIGMPLGELVFDIGGGMREGKTFKAAQIGGTIGRLHPAAPPERARGLRIPRRAGRHHGLGRPHRHGRGHLHGGHVPVLPRVRAGRILRQVHALPGGHEADAGNPGPHLRGQGAGGRHRAPDRLGQHDQGHGPLRARPDSAQPRPLCNPPFPRRVRRAHQGPQMPRWACAPSWCAPRARTRARRAWTCRAS